MARSVSYCLFLILAANLLYGDLVIGGPYAGYVASAGGTELRAIYGVPGSFRFGDPIPLPAGVTRIHLAPRQDFGLAQRGEAGLGVLFLAGAAVSRVVSIQNALASPDCITFSPSGSSAVLFSSSANRLQMVTGLPDAASLTLDFDAATLPEVPRATAVSDDGKVLLAASATAVYLVSPRGPAQLVLSLGDLRSIVFLPNSKDAVAVDGATGSIHLLRGLDTNPSARLIATGLDGIGRIYPQWNGGSVFVSLPGTNQLASVDLPSGEVRGFASTVAPVELIPLRNRDTFLISNQPRQPGWIFFQDGNVGRTVGIPAVPDLTQQSK